MRCRVSLVVGLLVLGLPTYVAMAQVKEHVRETDRPHEIVTMDNMRSLVPSLVALGWDDFFLGKGEEIRLSPGQAQQLLFLNLEFVAATRQLQERVTEAELALYDKLDKDRVSVQEVEDQARWAATLRGEFVVLRFRYLLRAINVLNHEQHQKLVASLNIQVPLNTVPAEKLEDLDPHPALPDARSPVMLQTAQYQENPEDKWLKEKAGRCRSQATISVRALLGYEQSREAAKRVTKLADQLLKLTEAGPRADTLALRRIAAQMHPELWLMESTSRELQLPISRNPSERSSQLGNRLRTEAMADALAKIIQELKQDVPGRAGVARKARQIRELADRWRKGVKQASEMLCLAPASAALSQ